MMRGLSGTGLGRVGLFTFGVIALLTIGALALAGRGMLTGADAQPAKRAIQPTGTEEATPEPVAETADKANQRERAVKEPSPVGDEASASATVPAGAIMSLSVPAMGISDIPVVEGTSEASLSQGAGHVPGTGYPWVPGSNTYIAGHRIGYPGTPSDHVFWNLPNLGQGDQILLTDSNGTTYTYAVSEIFEVSPTDLTVTAPTGGDVVSLQTCIEDYGDYWTPGPNWFVRYVVRAERV
ncbi:MAG TPA: class E sortase [Rubrobacter sp.]|jgi:sortase A|nr:class E sortase [Rubrobacter sp.]